MAPKDQNEAADLYVKEKTREIIFNMKAADVPKGVWFSTFCLTAPLLTTTGYLAMMAPMAANAAIVDPIHFAYVARSCLRILSLNVSFIGGVHFGFASAQWDTARSSEEERALSL